MNPYPPGTMAHDLWSLDAELTHVRRLLVVAALRRAGAVLDWAARSWREWLAL